MSESVVVIGNFDGVHPGHVRVLREAARLEPNLPLVVVTFWPHPAHVLRPEQAPGLLTSLEERVELLMEAGASRVEVIDFTRELSKLTPEEFIEQHIVPLQPRRVVVGENFRFGHRAAGDVAALQQLGQGRFEVTALDLVTCGDEETASTLIRDALAAGDVRRAGKHLGRPFRYTGVVVHGDHRGRELGFPTANLAVPALRACPADGVYAGWMVRLDNRDADGNPLPEGEAPARWRAAISVGSNPTFDGVSRRVESFVLDRTDLDLYGVEVGVDFCGRIRGQVKFDGVAALISQMHEDVAKCRVLLDQASCERRRDLR